MKAMKKIYIAPVSYDVWLGGEEGYAQQPDLTVGSKFEGGEDDILVREDSETDLWSESDTSWSSSGGVWDNAW